ncbi:hypothetical protein J7E81_28440 [Bacillus sp. ISL-18]|uniref:hypothetical protein n=1 Tax=Bacillus sp. ISL-18 TaxID=2819118 RepID=UPI001BE84AB9|nr:hypothetical protein [Bacillus sp. ISL-18]MBT2659106.1 hypothetical protein [Bacillus sp. ISL-18]
MLPNLIRIGLLLISWSTLFFIPKKTLKTYTPVAIFASILLVIESILAVPFKWWTVKGGLLHKFFNDFSFIFGPFFVGTILFFRFTFRKFWLYAITNLLMDLFLAFPVSWLSQKLNVFKLVNFKPKHIFYTAIIYAIVIYGFQNFITRSKIRR